MDVIHGKISPTIDTEKQLREIIPNYPKILDKRLQHRLDEYSRELIGLSKFVVLGFAGDVPGMLFLSTAGLVIRDSKTLSITPILTNATGVNVSLYFLVPGIGHSLRINGIYNVAENSSEIVIRNAYFHCARAAARADLWRDDLPIQFDSKTGPREFVAKSPFLLLKSSNVNGETELSPRGDEPGFIKMLDDERLLLPERPGNKVAVSLRNIINNGGVELLLLVPCCHSLLRVSGEAYVTSNKAVLASCVVAGKRPKIGIVIEKCRFQLERSETIASSNPWNAKAYVDKKRISSFSKALSAHMNGEGVVGKVATPIISAVVKRDMKNLY